MNPVDRMFLCLPMKTSTNNQIPTVVVIINISVTLPPWPETHPPVKRLVSSPPGEPVSSGVPSTSPPPTSRWKDGMDELAVEDWIFGRICTTYAIVYTDRAAISEFHYSLLTVSRGSLPTCYRSVLCRLSSGQQLDRNRCTTRKLPDNKQELCAQILREICSRLLSQAIVT